MDADPAMPRPGAASDPGVDVLSGPDIAGRVVRGGMAQAIGFGVVNLLGVAGSVVLLRHLGVAGYGRYGTVIALVGIASGLADVGLNLTGARELSLMPLGDRRRLLGALLGARLILLTAAGMAAVAFAALAGYGSALVAGTALAAGGGVLIGAQSTLTLPLLVELRNGLLSLNEVLKQAILFAGIVILTLAGATLTPFFGVQLAVGAGALLAVPLLVDRAQLVLPSLSRVELRQLAFTALPVAIAAVLTAFYVRVLVVIASLLSTTYQTGLFVVSERVVEMLGGLAMLLVGVLLPVVTVAARDDRLRLSYVLAGATRLALLGGGLLSLVTIVAARPIVVLLGGEPFAPAASVLRLDGPTVLTSFLVSVWIAFMIADGRRRALVQCTIVGTLTLFVAGIPLIAALDARGAALAALIADVALAAVCLRTTRRVGDGRIGIGADFLARYVSALAAAAATALAVGAIASPAVAALAAAAVFAGGAFALGIVPAEMTAHLPHR